MDTTKILLVVCLTLVIVIGINAMIYAALRRGNDVGQIELLRRAVRRTRQPWQAEDEALKELAQRVAELKEKGRGDKG
jgi:hypothetical protein